MLTHLSLIRILLPKSTRSRQSTMSNFTLMGWRNMTSFFNSSGTYMSPIWMRSKLQVQKLGSILIQQLLSLCTMTPFLSLSVHVILIEIIMSWMDHHAFLTRTMKRSKRSSLMQMKLMSPSSSGANHQQLSYVCKLITHHISGQQF